MFAYRLRQVVGHAVAERLLACGGNADAGLEHLAGGLARTKAGHPHLSGDLFECGVDIAIEFGFIDGNGQLDLVSL